MKQSKMSREELEAESLRLSVLIQKGSEAELRGGAEMSKRPLSLEEMREDVRRQREDPSTRWLSGDKKNS